IQRQGLTLRANLKQRTVGHYAAGLAKDQLAHVEELAIDLQGNEPPCVTGQQAGAHAQLVTVIAVALLEVLRAQQHPFLPDHVMQGHAHLPWCSVRSLIPRASTCSPTRCRTCCGSGITSLHW